MKYIRTKDRIYALIDLPYRRWEIRGNIAYLYEKGTTWKADIIKQADTIEELCDEFVSVFKNLTPELLEPKFVSSKETLITSWRNRLEDEYLFKDTVVYGAIWTDKGLIYVAKMNEKGELELL